MEDTSEKSSTRKLGTGKTKLLCIGQKKKKSFDILKECSNICTR